MHQKIVKHLIFPLHEKILGRDTYKFLQGLEKEQYLEKGRLEELKFEKLKALLIHAQKIFLSIRNGLTGLDSTRKKRSALTILRFCPCCPRRRFGKILRT